MADVIIQDPVINSPFAEPVRHFEFGDRGITGVINEGRRQSSYFVPTPQGRRQTAQLSLEAEWTTDRLRDNELVNRIREKVATWRKGGHAGVTATTARLLEYWTHPDRDRKLFFCQIEALETAIYLSEVASKYGDAWIANRLREANEAGGNPDLFRVAFKMATGSGKTVVMGMLMAWQALNKLANPQDARFSDAFLVVCPGLTVRDRLRVLLPNDPASYYRQLDLLPPDLLEKLERAKVVITNYQAFLPRDGGDAARMARKLLGGEETGASRESPTQVVRRVCGELGNKKNIVVLNDDGHHCYRGRAEAEDEPERKGDDREEADQREEEALVWLSGIEAVRGRIGVKVVYDLSATPFFLNGSGWPEGTLFPWVVSDFSLIDAIEAGIVKVPRVAAGDNQMSGTLSTYHQLWETIRTYLPRAGQGTQAVTGDPVLPVQLEGAIGSLFQNYQKYHDLWERNADARAKGLTAPVFIVVAAELLWAKAVQLEPRNRYAEIARAAVARGKTSRFARLVAAPRFRISAAVALAVVIGITGLVALGYYATGSRRRSPTDRVQPLPPAAALRIDLTGYERRTDGSATTFVPESGLFTSGSNHLSDQAREMLSRLAARLAPAGAKIKLEIVGYTDDVPLRSSSQFVDNRALGMARALAAYDYLTRTLQVDPNNVFVTSSGERSPPFAGNDEMSRTRNRTVIFRLSGS